MIREETGLGEGVPDVSIVIPVKDQLPLLASCLDSLDSTRGELTFEIVVVDDDSAATTARALADWERSGRIGLVKAPEAGNFAASCNAGAAVAKGRTLVLLNSDIEARSGWLESLVRALDEPGIGAVGARLLFPDGTVQHAGIAFRPDGMPYHPNRGLDGDSPLVTTRRDMPGLTGACLAIRAELFASLGGFDTGYRFQVEDLDLCLRIWAKGLRVVYEPASCLLHHEGGSSGARPEKDRIYGEGLSRLFNSWADKGGFPPAVQALQGFPAMLKSSGTKSSSSTATHSGIPTGDLRSGGARSSPSTASLSGIPSGDPRVSVIVPTCDRPVFLRRALESLTTQTFRDFEVVVVDDAGCDVSMVVEEFLDKGLSIRLVVQSERRGLGAARNAGIALARAAWIAYLDDDDLYYPDHLRLLLETLERSGAKVAYSDSMRAVEEEQDGQWVVLSNELAMSNEFDRDGFLRNNLTPVNNVIHARTCWQEVGGIDESLPVLEDWDFWIRLSRRWNFVHVPVATTEIRWRSNGANMTFQRQNLFQPTRDRIARKVAAMLKAEETGRTGVSIVIPVHGNLELTRQCLDAVRSTTDATTTEIVVVDDASPDHSAAWLREESARGRLQAVILPRNKGFAGACNAGAAASSGRTILFLNNDTIVQAGWLDAMLAGLEDPTVGLVGSRLLYPEGDIQHAGIRMMADGKAVHEFRHAAGSDPRVMVSRDRAFVTGACIALHRELFTKIGGFDEGYHMYVEDLDLCMKVWNLGLRVRYVAESVVVHLESRTVPDPSRRADLVKSGMARLMERWMGCWPEALLDLPDWPSHFRKGTSIRWCAPMFVEGPDAMAHRRIVQFLEPLLPSLQVDPGRNEASVMAALRQDPDATKLWSRVLSRPHDEAVCVFDSGSADAWEEAGRPSDHVVFARFLEDVSDRRFADFLEAAAIVLACGSEIASACRARGIRGELIGLPTLEDGMFPEALLGACARLMEGTPRAESDEATPMLHWMAPTLNYSGYARLNREAFLAFTDSSVKGISHDSLAASPAFLDDQKDADEAEVARWGRAMEAVPATSGLCLISVPACDFARVRALRPKFARYAGLTMFETDQLPGRWKDGCLEMDEIWVPSTFNLKTFAASGVPEGILHRIPCGIDMDRFRPGFAKPMALASRRRTNFLSVFEWSPRKGWDVLLGAWARAFDPSDDVSLTIKSYIAHSQPGEIRRRIDAWYRENGIDPTSIAPIEVVDAFLSDGGMASLYAAADVFVLPTRGEGWGLPYLEAMASGIPVIATGWSAHLDFVTDANGYLVDHRLVKVGQAQTAHSSYYVADHRWADPSLDHLVELMRHCAKRPEEVRERGVRARRDVESEWSSRRTAAWIAKRAVPRPVAVATRSPVPFAPVVSEQGLPSVAWCGPLFNHTGYARQSREAVTALVNLGTSVSVDPQQNDLKWFEGLRSDAAAMAHWKRVLSTPAGGDVLVCCDLPSDARGAHDVFAEMTTGHPESRSRVAWTMFETDRAPVGWAEKLNRLDQVWVPSRQVHAAFLASGVDSSRLRIVPNGLDPVAYANARPYALPGPVKGTTFLSVFQWSRRKGYDVLLSAWAQAFRASDDVRLVLRCHAAGGVSARAQLDSWLSRSGHSLERMAPVILIEDFIPEPEMAGLYAASDVFVLPTRGEGWGLPFLEAMASGKPSIATAWGGQTDFLHEGVAWMLPASVLVPVDAEALRENPFLTPEHRWADPQVADLVPALLAANGSADERRRKGTRARGEFLARWTSAHTAQIISASLRELRGQDTVLQPRHGRIGGSRLSGVLASIAGGLRRDPAAHATSQVAVREPSGPPSSQNPSQTAGSRSTAPKVSVILPTRDRPVFLRRALESLCKQTFRDFEVVVVDDSGCDVSAIVADYARGGMRVRLEIHPERKGLGAARNTGIRNARGRWIAYLDDDDLYYPDHLRLILDALDRTGAKVAYSDSMRAVEEEREGEWVVLSNELAMSNDFDRDAFLRTNLTPVNNVIHERDCWEQVGGIDESLPVLEDWDFWIRLSRRWDFVHVPVATTEIRWRSNGANMTFQRQREFQPTRDRIAAKVTEMLRLEALEREGVSMVILVRDCLDVTRECLASLELHTPEPHEILLVDNGSNAETTAWLRDWVATRPRSVLVRNDDNRGFAGGNNQGLALAKGRFLLLLNNDTVLTPGWLGRMLDVLRRHPECGAVGPVSNRVSGPQLDATATYSDAAGLVLHAEDRSRRFRGRSDEILRAVGFCLLFRREVFEAVGGLDERFGKGNFEDDDFSLRVRHAGWSSRMALDSFVHHVGGATFRGENIDYTKSLLTNWAIFLRKWGLPEDLPYEKGYPFQQSPPKSALSRIETPSPLGDHELVEPRVFLPAKKASASGAKTMPEKTVSLEAATVKPSASAEHDLESLSAILFQVESAVAMQDSQQADALSREAVEIHPDQPLAWLSRAMVLRGAGKSGKALEALTKSAALGGGAEVVYETMALHLQDGRDGPALVQWNLLRTKHPQWVKERKAMHQTQGLPWLPDRFAKPGKSPKKPAGKKR